MARLRKGERNRKERVVKHKLTRHFLGIREAELAEELGWQRRTVNNYLRNLQQKGAAYKEGRSWFTEDW